MPDDSGEHPAVTPFDANTELWSVSEARDKLPEEQRIAVALVLVEGLSYKEAAALLEVPIGTLTSRLARRTDVNYDDETLMAYVDGELDEPRRAEIASALEKDPALKQRVEDQRALRAPAPPWRAREWFAVAASLVLGIFISWRAFAPGGALIEASNGALVARGELEKALDGQLAADNGADRAVSIGLSFETRGGGYCRSFALPASQTSGLACREKGEWHTPATAASNSSRSDMQQAAGSIPPAILAAIEARISGDPLDAAGEAGAVQGGWEPAPPPK